MRALRAMKALRGAAVAAAAFGVASGPGLAAAFADSSGVRAETTTPIQHVVGIFQENVSFDHYFATYPLAANADGSPGQCNQQGRELPVLEEHGDHDHLG